MTTITVGSGLGLQGTSLTQQNGLGPDGNAAVGGQGLAQATVNAATGNLVVQTQDEFVSSIGAIDESLLETYNSLGSTGGYDANGWVLSVSSSLGGLTSTTSTSDASFTRIGADGHVATFTYNSSFAYAGGTGAWVNSSDPGVNEYISFSGSGTTGTWTLHEGSSGIIQTYSNATATLGRLLTTADLNGNTLTYAYNSTGLVSTVTDASGQSLTLNYGTTATTNHNLLSITIKAYAAAQLSTTTGPVMQAAFTVVNYVFSGTQLTAVQVTLATGQTFSTQYSYKTGTNLLTQIAQSDGSILNIAYGTSNRVSTLTDGLGRVTSFNYSVAGQTTVTDALGNKTVYHYSASYGSSDELTQVDEPAVNGTVNSIKYLYDASGNVKQVTDAEGRSTYFSYDGHDNLIEFQDALGNTTLRSYDSADHLQTETQYTTPQTVGATLAGTSAGKLPAATASNSVTTYYVYSSDGKENLDYVISPQGRVTQYLYDSKGERTRSIAFTGATYSVATYGTAPSAATMTTWANAQSPSLTERTDYAWDMTGQVLTTTTYGSISSGNVTSNPGVTYSIYDYRGRLLFEIDPDATVTVNPSNLSTLTGAAHVTAYAYDGLGRELSVTNGANQKTTYSYSTLATALPNPGTGTAVTAIPGGQSTSLTVTAANGLVTTTVYDADGEVLSVAQAKGSTSYGTSSYFYDTDGHLVMSADPTGARTIYLYDSRGRQVGVISPQLDPTGTGYNLTETTYNNDNQVVQTLQHGNLVAKAKVSAYLGATASSVFGTGTGNIAPLTLAGVEPTTSSLDRKSYSYYDTAGHLIYSIDGAGYVTGHSYDTAGRLLSTTQYATTTYNSTPASIPAVDTAAASITIPTSSSDRTVHYYYDNDGLQTGTLDADGYFTQTVYDSAGQVQETIAYANAPVIPTGYTAATATTTLLAGWTTKDSVHDQTSWVLYNNQGLVIATIDADGYVTQTGYDPAGNKTSQTRYATALTNYTSYAGGAYTVGPPGTTGTYVVTTSAQDQTQSWTTYDGLNRVVTAIDYQGTVTQYNYDATTGFLTSVVSAYSPSNPQGQTNALGMSDGRTTSYFYDALGRVTETLTGLGSAAYQASNYNSATLASDGTTTVYDLAGRKIQTTDADGHSSWYYYDSDSRLLYSVDALGDVTGYQYDAFGDVSQTTQYATAIATSGLAGGLVTTAFTSLLQTSTSDRTSKYSYTDKRGLLTKTTDALGFTSSETYDAFGELSSKSRDVGATPGAATRTDTYSYYNRGLLKQTVEDSATGGLAISSSQSYDAFGRVTSSTDANNNTTTTHYGDPLGHIVTVTDALGASSITTYDAFSRILTQQDRSGAITSYSYSDSTQTLTVTDPLGNVVTSISNRHGQTLQTVDGTGVTTIYSYDADGNLVGTTDADGNLTQSQYDTADLLKQSIDANGIVTQYSYDAANRVLTRTVDPTGLNLSTQYRYDAFGEAFQVIDPTGVVTETVFDNKGEATAVIVDAVQRTGQPAPLMLATQYTYDAESRQLTVIQGMQASGSTGNWSFATAVGTTTTKYLYDHLGRRTSSIVDPNGLKITTKYGYDSDSNLTTQTDADGNVTRYAYDADNQLGYTIDALGDVTGYAYDADGRVIQTTQYATAITPSSVPTNATAAQVTPLVNAGNPANEVTQTVYDAGGHVACSIDAMGDVTGYLYDADGRLIQTSKYPVPISLSNLPANPAMTDVQRAMALTQQVYSLSAQPSALVQGGSYVGTNPIQFGQGPGSNQLQLTAQTLTSGSTTSANLKGTTVSTISAQSGVVYHAEFSRADTQAGYFLLGVQGSNGSNTLKLFAQISGSTLKAYGNDGTNTFTLTLGTLKTGVTYVSEVEVTATGATLYVYQKGQPRTSGWSYEMNQAWTTAQTLVQVNAATTYGNAVLNISALEEYPAATEVTRTVYDTAGRVAYGIDALGDVTGYSYDADGRVTQTTTYATPIIAGLPVNPSVADVQAAMVQSLRTYALNQAGYGGLNSGGTNNSITNSANASDVPIVGDTTNSRLILTSNTVAPPASSSNATLAGPSMLSLAACGSVVSHTEFTRADLGAGQFYIGANGYDTSGTQSQKLAISLNGSSLQAYYYDSTGGHTVAMQGSLQTLQANVTYAADVVVTAAGATLYVYAKGQSRASGASYAMNEGWSQARVWIQVNASANYGNSSGSTVTYVTNVQEYQAISAANTANETAQTVYDAAGRAAYSIDALGNVTAYAYDADSRVTLTTKYATPIELSSLPANASPVDVQLAMVQSLQNYGLGAQPGTLTQVGSFSGNNPIQFGQGTGSNQLQLTSQQLASGSSGTNAGIKGTSLQSISSQGSVVFHAEFSRADVGAGLFYIGVTGTDTSGNTLKLATSISGGTVKAYVVSGTQTISGSLQTLQAGVTYVSEVVVTASGATLYVYQKGLSRTSGDSYSMSGNWSTATSWAQVNASSSFSNSVTDISDLQEWRAISAANTANQTAETVYDAAGRVAYSIDALGDVTGYQHDAAGRLAQTTRYATALTQLSTPIAPGTILSQSTLEGIMASVAGTSDESTINTYDNAGRLLSVQDAALNTESYTYDAFGNKLTDTNKIGNQTAPAGTTQSAWAAAHTWTYQFDADNRMVLDLSPQASADLNGATKGTAVVEATQIVYNAFSDVIKNIQGYYLPAASYVPGSSAFKALRATTSSYDALNRQTGTSSGDGVTGTVGVYNSSSDTVSAEAIASTTQYDAMGNAVVGLDAAGNYSYKVYNAGNQLQYDIDADGYVTGYTYDAFGNQTDITRYANAINAGAAGHTGGQAYTVSQVLAGLSPGSSDRMISTTYDTLNRKLQVTQPIVNYYVPSGTGTADSGAASPLTDYVYDAFSDLIKQSSLIDAAGGNAAAQTWNSTWYGYDTDGHQTSVLDALGYYTANQYDAFGNLAQTTQYAATQNVPIDTATLLANFNGFTATQTPASANSALGYDRTTAYAYDLLNEQTGVTRVGVEYGKQTGSQTTSTTGNLTSTTQYDALGNVIATTDDSGATTYTYYDNVGRVQAVVSPAQQANNIGNYTISSVDLQAALELDRISGGDQVARANGASPLTNVTTYDYSLSLSWSSLAAEGSGSIQIVVDHDGTLTTTTLGNQATSTEVTWAGDATSPVTSITLSMEMPAGSGQFATIITMGEIPIGSPPFDGTSYGSASQQSLLVSGINPGATAATLSCTGASSGATASWSPSLQSIGNGIWTAAMPTTAQLAVGTYSYTLAATVNGVSTPLQSGNLSLAAPAGEDPSITSDAGGQILPLSVMQYDVLGDEVVQTRYEQGAALINSGGSYAIVGTSADDQTTIQAFNALGWMTSTTDADKNTTNDAYNPFGHIGKTWRTQTDSVSGAMTQSTVYLYDNDGNQTTTTQRIQNPLDQGVTLISNTVATYDAFGEITQKVTDATQFGSGTNTATTEVEKYDADGRLWETNQGGLITAYEYDLEGNITAQVLLNATAVSSTPVQLAGTAGAIETDYVRDTDGRAIEEVQPGFSAWPSSADGTDPVQMFTAGVAYSGWSAIYNAPPPPPPPPGTSPPSPIRPMVGGGGGNTSMKVTLNWVALSALSGQQVQISVNGEVVETESAADCETGASLAWVDSGDEGGSSLTSATVAIENASGTWVTVRSFGAPSSTLQISTPQVYGVTLSGSISYSYIGTPPSGQPASGTLAATSLVPGAYTCSVTGLASGQYSYSFNLVQAGTGVTSSGTTTYATYTGTFTVSGGAVSSMSTPTTAPTTITPIVWQQLDRWGNAIVSVDPRYGSTVNPFTAPGTVVAAAAPWASYYRYDDQNHNIEVTQPAVDAWLGSGSDNTTVTENKGYTGNSYTYYDADGRVIATEDNSGNESQRFYDSAGQLIEELDPMGAEIRHVYDGLGREVDTLQNNGTTVSRIYDHMNRLLLQQTSGYTSGPRFTRYAYDELGNRISQDTGISGNITDTNAATENTDGMITQYRYDTQGNVVQELDPGRAGTTVGSAYTVSYTFDSQQHKLSQTDGNDITQVWTYDAFGHTRTYKDLGGLKTTYSYDNFGRLQSQSTPASSQTINGAAAATGNQNQVYGYYENGELQSITDNTNDTLTYYEYDAAGNRTTERMILTTGGANPAFAGTLSDTRISYDALNRETEVRSSYEVVDYLYDADGNRRRVYAKYYTGEDPYTSHTQDYWYSYDDDNRINVSEGVLSNGTVTTDATTGKGIVNDYDSGGDRAEMVQYEKSGSTYQQAVYTYSFDPDNRIVGTTRQAGSGPQVEISTRTYDTQGRTTEYASYDPAGSVASGTIDANATMTATTYNTRGLVQTQTDYAGTTGNTWDAANTSVEYSTPSGGSVKDKNGNLVAGYDGAGNVLAYQVKGLTGTTYTQDYSYQYLLLGSNYKEAYIYGSGTASAGGFTPGSTNEYYDSNDNLISLNKSGGTYQSETFVNTLAGEALSSVNNVSGTTSTTTDTSYLYANNDPIGSISSDSSVGANFDFNYTPVSDQYPSSTPGQYVAQAGDTLEGVAYAVYGDSSLWYLIADANGLSDGVMLNAGQTLTIPNQITNIHNSSSTYQPYDAAKVVGNTTPTLKYLPPPPPPPVGASCGIAMIIVIIVTVIVTVVTEGATSELLGEETAADGSIALEAGSVAATIGPTATGIVAGAVGAAAGSVAGQLVGMALGVQKNFSWSAVGTAALGGAISAGVGDIPNGGSPLADVGKAVLSNVATQGVDIAIGQQKSFSWAGVAAAAVSAGLEIAENGGKAADLSQPKVRFGFGDVASGLSNIDWGKVAEGTFNGLVSGSVKALLTSNGHEQFASIAADAFGNALANGMVAAAQFQAQIDQLGAAGQDSYAFWIGQGKSPQEALALGKGADQSAAAPGSPAVTTPDNASAGAESPTVSAPSPFGSLPASGGVNWGGSLAFPVTPLPDWASAVPTAPTPYTVGPEGAQGYWGVARAMLGTDASNADVENLTQQLMTANPGVTTLHLGQQLNLGDGTISQQALQTYGAMNQGYQASLQANAAAAQGSQSLSGGPNAPPSSSGTPVPGSPAASSPGGESTAGPSFLQRLGDAFLDPLGDALLDPASIGFGVLFTGAYNYANRIPSTATTLFSTLTSLDENGNVVGFIQGWSVTTKNASFSASALSAGEVESKTSFAAAMGDVEPELNILIPASATNASFNTYTITSTSSWSGVVGKIAGSPLTGGAIDAIVGWNEDPATFTPTQKAAGVALDATAGTTISYTCDQLGEKAFVAAEVDGGIEGAPETGLLSLLAGPVFGISTAVVCNYGANSVWSAFRAPIINSVTGGSAPVGLTYGFVPWGIPVGGGAPW